MSVEKFIILPDVTCELNADIRKQYDIDVILGHVSYPNGKEENSMLDWKDCSFLKTHTGEEFYEELSKNPSGFTSAPPNIQEFYNAFESYVKEGYGVLSMSISSGMSGTYNFAVKAKEMILEKYKDAKIECFDSLRFGPGYGLMAIYASILRSEGKSLEEVKEFLESNKNRFHQIGWLDDLSFVAKKGRLSHAKAFMGKLMGIKPLGEFDYNGLTTVIGKAKGEKSAYKVKSPGEINPQFPENAKELGMITGYMSPLAEWISSISPYFGTSIYSSPGGLIDEVLYYTRGFDTILESSILMMAFIIASWLAINYTMDKRDIEKDLRKAIGDSAKVAREVKLNDEKARTKQLRRDN